MDTTLESYSMNSDGGFSVRVNGLRRTIQSLRLSRRRSLNEKELSRLQEIARQKVANIIEFTLRQNNNPVDRNKIELVVEKEFGNNPIYQKILTKREPSQAEIMAAQDEFVGLIEGRRVKSPELRIWIAQLIHRII